MSNTDRRAFLAGAGALGLGAAGFALGAGPAGAEPAAGAGTAAATAPGAPFAPAAGPRSRVIISNDLGADPDGLFAFVHQILSPSTEVRAIVGAHAQLPNDPFDPGPNQALNSQNAAKLMLNRMGLAGKFPTYAGANAKLPNATTPVVTEGSQAIVREAMRKDGKPLFITAGGTLTDVASAVLQEPRVAERATLVWIGGQGYPNGGGEYNFNADPAAAQVLFNDTTMPIWQIPAPVYSMCMVSDYELQQGVSRAGAIGAYLWSNQLAYYKRFKERINFGEVYQLGDSPLVLLTALTSPWNPTATYTSPYDEIFAPTVNPDGTYRTRTDGRKIRVYTGVDTRLMFADFFAKLRQNYGG